MSSDAIKLNENEKAIRWQTHIPGYPGYFANWKGEILSYWGADKKISRQVPIVLKGDRKPLSKNFRFRIRHKSGRIDRHFRTHLILMAFKGPRPKGAEARHKNGPSNSPDNLMWVKRESTKTR